MAPMLGRSSAGSTVPRRATLEGVNGILEPRERVVRRWYAVRARDLPWRRPGVSAWAVLVSEFMLQQTPVARVLPVYDAWLLRWPTPAALADAAPGEAVRDHAGPDDD